MNHLKYHFTSLRFGFRAPVDSDLDVLHQCFNDYKLMKYWIDGFCDDIQKTQKKLQYMIKHWEKHGFGDWVVVDLSTENVVGVCGFDSELDPTCPTNLGCFIQRKYHGKGIPIEITLSVLKYVFENNIFDEIVAYTHPDNKPALRALKRCNFIYAGEEITSNEHRLKYKIQKEDFDCNIGASIGVSQELR